MLPAPGETIEIACPECEGRAAAGAEAPCEVCGGTRWVKLDGCPLSAQNVPPDCWEMLGLVDIFEDAKVLPLGGGSLEQSQAFMDCLGFVRREGNRIRLAQIERRR